MSLPSPEIRILVEVPAHGAPAPDLICAWARAASQAGADALRVGPARESQARELGAWVEVRKAVLRLDLDLIVTVSAPEDVGFFQRVGVGGLAVSTAAAGGEALWDAAGRAHLPVLVLSDAAPDPTLEAALGCLQRYDVELTVLYGSADRPTPAEQLGLSRVTSGSLGRRWTSGFADRSGTGWPALAACALGVALVEVPLSLSAYLPGGEGALTPEALEHTVKGLRYLAWARAHEAPPGASLPSTP